MKNNPVAKNAHKFNKSNVMRDRKKDLKKGTVKHKGRDYAKEYADYHSDPEQIKRRAARNAARRVMKGRKELTDEKDVHHKDNNPMNNDKSNLSIVTQHYNRREPRMRSEATMVTRMGDFKSIAQTIAKNKIDSGSNKQVMGYLRAMGKKIRLERDPNSRSGVKVVIEKRLQFGDKVKTPQGAVEIKKRDTRGMRGKQDGYDLVLHMKNGKKTSMGSHPAPTTSAVTNMAKRFKDGVPSYMAHLNKESVEEASILKTVHKNVTNKKSVEKDRKKAVKTVKDIHRGKYAGVKMANEDDDPCWDTHKKVGTKMKGGKRVNDCVPKNEETVLEEAMLNEFSDAQLAQLKKAYADLERINVTSPTYKKLKAMIAKMDVKALEKVARAKVKFVSQIAAREYEVKSGNRLKAKDYMESTELEEKSKGLWHNIRKKRERGEPKAKPGDKDYPKTLNIESTELDEAIGKLGPNASREDKIKHTMKIMKMYPANKGKSEKQLRKGATDYIDQFTNKNKKDDAYIAKMKAKKESVDEAALEEKTKWKMGDGRPRNGAHIENDRFWNLPMDSLKYIRKDAHAAMKANPNGRKAGKYADEVNDAETVMAWRKKNGIKESVKKKTFDKLRGRS